MPPSLMGYLHITESQRFLRYSLEAGGWDPGDPLGLPIAHPPGRVLCGLQRGTAWAPQGTPKAARALASSLDPKASYTGATSR